MPQAGDKNQWIGRVLLKKLISFCWLEVTMQHPLVPKSKMDLETANKAVLAGNPEVLPVLGELLEWLQDYNWPVAKVLAPFLASIGLPLVRHIDHVFSSNDEIWKYWVIVCLISCNDDLFAHYKHRLLEYAQNPTESDRDNELDEVSTDILVERGCLPNSD